MEIYTQRSIFLICAVFFLNYPVNYARHFQPHIVSSWSRQFETDFGNLYKFMGVPVFTPDATQGDEYVIKSYNDDSAEKELDRIVRVMRLLTQNKEKLVQNLREVAEDYYKNYDINQTISCSTYVYDRAKAITSVISNDTINPTGEDKCQKKKYIFLEQNPLLYNMSVTFDKPTAHVPTNVYDGSKSILKVANWTENLDFQLKKNLKADSTLKFQYFASSNGMFKVYPGIKWHIQIDQVGESSPVDFFDCRSQTWYVEAATYPKDIVILVDKSGSMKGRRETIANLTVSEILSTLTENDFFNVILFNESTIYADPIFTNILLQATLKNKERIMNKLNITPSGIADYAAGLRAAFDLLRESRATSSPSSTCSQAIMIISDGAPDYYEALFDERNPEKDIRVFTYMIGQEASDRDNVRKMACNNRGFFVQISTLADVKENVQTYLPVMARTNALIRSRYTVWTGVHDTQIKGKTEIPKPPPPTEAPTPSTTPVPDYHADDDIPTPTPAPAKRNTTKKKEPLTIFTSVAQAVYDIKEETAEKNYGNMIGVTGLDVPVSEFEKLVPPWKYGVNGYVFAINNNGYILFHRNFRPIYKGKFRPFYQNVDLAELEQSVDLTLVDNNPNYEMELRTEMINRKTGVQDMEIINVPDNYETSYKQKMRYFYKPLDKTPFTIGLALPWTNKRSAEYLGFKQRLPPFQSEVGEKIELKKYSEDFYEGCERKSPLSKNIVKIIPFPFCDFNEDLIRIYETDPICAFRKVLLNSTLRRELNCNEEFIAQIHYDAIRTDRWGAVWSVGSADDNRKKSRYGIEQVFMIRYSGLIRLFNDSMPSDPNFIDNHLEGIRDTIFRTTVDFAQYMDDRKDFMYFHVPSPDIVKRRLNDGKNFSIVGTTIINTKNKIVPSGVIGLQIVYEKFRELFMNITSKCPNGNGYCKSCEDQDVDCYLITSSAFVVASTTKEDIGQSFGKVDCEILNEMMKSGIFTNQTVYDFQAVCTYPLMDTSFAIRLIDPITRLIGSFVWLMYNVSIVLLEFFSTTLWALISSAQEYMTYSGKTSPILSNAPNLTATKNLEGDLGLIRKVERQVVICRNHTDEEEVMKCFQDYLNTLCRRVGSDASSECITACKSLRKFSPDHWNAHEKCVYPSKPCSKEHLIIEPTYLIDKDARKSLNGEIPNCCKGVDSSRKWFARPIKNSNLILVTVSPGRTKCRCRCSPPFQRSQELTPIWTNTSQPFRRPPAWNCNSDSRKENDSSCTNHGTQLNSRIGLHLLWAIFVLHFIRNR